MTSISKILTQSIRIISFVALIFLLFGCSRKTPSTDKSTSDTGHGYADPTEQKEPYKYFTDLTLREQQYIYHLLKALSLNEKESLITELESARQFASPADNRALTELVDYIRTGDAQSLKRYRTIRKESNAQTVRFDFQVLDMIDVSSNNFPLDGKVLIGDTEFDAELKLEHNRMGGVIDVKVISREEKGD